MDITKEWACELEYKLFNLSQKKKDFKNKQSLRGQYQRTNICINEVTEEEDECGTEKVFEEIIARNFTSLVKDIHLQIQGAQQTPNKITPKKSMIYTWQSDCWKLKTKKKYWK